MATMMVVQEEAQPDEVLIEAGREEDDETAEALWATTGARARAQGAPAVRLIAWDGKSHTFLGVADYFRAFPPEDAFGAVAVVPEDRHRGVGGALLRELARVALRNGKRNLAGFMREDDPAAWRLLRAAGVPVRLHNVEGGLYYELDLVPLLGQKSVESSSALARSESSEHKRPSQH